MLVDTLRISKRIINSSLIGPNNSKLRWVTQRPLAVMEVILPAHYHPIGSQITVPVSTIMCTKPFGQCATTCGQTWFAFETFSQMNGKRTLFFTDASKSTDVLLQYRLRVERTVVECSLHSVFCFLRFCCAIFLALLSSLYFSLLNPALSLSLLVRWSISDPHSFLSPW